MKEFPKAKESEEALLGAILIDPSILDRVSVEVSDFYDIGNQTIYAAMRSIGSRDLDVVVLTELLERKNKLEEVGGHGYLLALPNSCPQTYNFETYERAIADTASRRKIIRLCEGLAGSAFDESKDIHDEISQAISDLVSSAKIKDGASHISEYLKELFVEVEERMKNPKTIYGLETGLKDFDDITSGLQPGEEFILAGQPGTGKSLLAFQLGCGMAERGHPGAVYSLEMSGLAMVRRRVSAVSQIPTYNMRSGKDMQQNWQRFLATVEKMEKLPIYISDASGWTTLQVRADLSRLKQQYGVEWFIVDYHDLLGDNVGKDFIEKSAHISQQLHMICKDLDLAGLVIQSLNKRGYSDPSMENLSGSTKVMHTADQIAVLSRDNDPNVVNLIWNKVREGDVGDAWIKLVKRPGYPSFVLKQPENTAEVDYTF